MENRSLKDMFYSQLAIKTYQSCPLKFRRRYLEGLFWPGNWAGDMEQREAIEQGRLFHLLAQRYYLQGETSAVGVISGEAASWLENLQAFRPYAAENTFYPEHELRLKVEGLRLMAKYDLLMVTPDGRAIIYDWKTNQSRPSARLWQKDFQTRVYQYLLCTAGGPYSPKGSFAPEDVTMIYWNPRYPHNVEPLSYSAKQMTKDDQDFRQLIQVIEAREFDEFYPTGDQRQCRFCEYSPICHGERAGQIELLEEDLDLDLDWESIDEISFA